MSFSVAAVYDRRTKHYPAPQRRKPAVEALCERLRGAKPAVTDSRSKNRPRGSASSSARVQRARLTQISTHSKARSSPFVAAVCGRRMKTAYILGKTSRASERRS